MGAPSPMQILFSMAEVTYPVWYRQAPPSLGCRAGSSSVMDAAFPAIALSLSTATSILHLGHPVPSSPSAEAYADLIGRSMLDAFSVFHQRPLPLYARLKVLNCIIVPQLLYRTECCPLNSAVLDYVGTLTKRFLMALCDASHSRFKRHSLVTGK